MASPDWQHGKPIERATSPEGVTVQELRYLSPSALKLADPESEGCARKWAFKYVAGIKEPETKAQALGTALHAELEEYQKTGRRDLSALALAGLHMVPPPGPGLAVEVGMGDEFSEAQYLDVVSIAMDARQEGRYDDADAILRQVGIWTASGVPILGRIDAISTRLENKGASDFEDTHDPPNTVEVIDWKTTSNLERYGKTPAELARDIQMLAYGCWVANRAPEVERVRLSHGYFQTRGAAKTRKVSVRLERDDMVRRWEYAERVARTVVHAAREIDPNKVEANVRACGAYGGCPYRAEHCTAGKGLSIADMMRLERRETIAGDFKRTVSAEGFVPMSAFLDKIKKKDAEKAGAAPGVAVPPEFAAAWKTIKAAKYGYPAVTGEAMKYVAAIDGVQIKGEAIGGAGDLGAATVSTAQEVLDIAAEIAGESTAPAENPATPAAEPEPTASKPAVTPLSPDSPGSDPALASAGAEDKDPNKKSTRKKKTDAPPPTAEKKADAPPATPDPNAGSFALFVDCVPSIPFERINGRLLALADRIAAEMTKELGALVADIRSCEAKPLGFGGWKGVYAAHVRELALELDGTLVVDARGSELMAIAAEELSKRAALCAWGTR